MGRAECLAGGEHLGPDGFQLRAGDHADRRHDGGIPKRQPRLAWTLAVWQPPNVPNVCEGAAELRWMPHEEASHTLHARVFPSLHA